MTGRRNTLEQMESLISSKSEEDDELQASRNLILTSIEEAEGRGGFIPWNRTHEAMDGAEQVLEKAQQYVLNGKPVRAVNLLLIILDEIMECFGGVDDSGGEVGGVIMESLEEIDLTIHNQHQRLNAGEVSELFHVIHTEAMKERYNDWTDWRFELFHALIPLTLNEPGLKRVLLGELERMENDPDSDDWIQESNIREITGLHAAIIEEHEGEEAAYQFKLDHLDRRPSFISGLIEYHIDRKEWEEALPLIEKGWKKAKNSRGKASFKEYERTVYQKSGQPEKEEAVLRELILTDAWAVDTWSFFEDWKAKQDPALWKEKLEALLGEIRSCSSLYLSICKEEALTERLLHCCQRSEGLVVQFYSLLKSEYPDEVKRLFERWVMEEARNASQRSQYKNVCRHIEKNAEANGKEHSVMLIEQLRETYKKKPAFQDELNHVEARI